MASDFKSIDFPMGTRLTVCGITLEVAADEKRRTSCFDCAVAESNVPEVLREKNSVQECDYSLAGGICQCLQCMGADREDGKPVHWQLIEEQ